MISKKKLAINISANYFGALVTVGIAFILTPLMVRYLGVSLYGVWVTLNTIVFYIGFLDLGLYNALVKYIAEYLGSKRYDELNNVVRASIFIYLIAGISSLVLCLIISHIITTVFNIPSHLIHIARLGIFLLGVKLLIIFPSTTLKGIIEGHQRYDVINYISVTFRILNALVTVILVLSGFGIISLIVTGIFISLAEFFYNIYIIKRLFPRISLRLGPMEKKTLKMLINFSFWSFLYNLAFEGGAEIEKLFIPILFSASYATHYAIAHTIASILFFATTPVVQVFFPIASELSSTNDQHHLKRLLIYGSKYTIAIALPIFTILFIFCEPIIAALFGSEYLDIAVPVLKYTLICYLSTNFVYTAITILIGLGKLKNLFLFLLAGGLIIILVTAATFKNLGVISVSFSFAVANFIVCFGFIFPYTCKIIKISALVYFKESFLKPFYPMLAAGILPMLLKNFTHDVSLFFSFFCAVLMVIFYVLLLYIFALSKDEKFTFISNLKQQVHRFSGKTQIS